jgi:hypothetical protein
MAGLGLILLTVLRIKTQLTAWLAVGLATMMIMPSAFHLSRGESSVIVMNIVFAVIAILLAFARFKSATIYSRYINGL